jgi:thioredoxin 1
MIEGNVKNFDELIKEGTVLVDFNANWCGPCKMLKPIVEEFAKDNDEIKVVSINIDDEDELSEKYNVSSIPCLVVFDKGKEIKRNVGLISRDDIDTLIGD